MAGAGGRAGASASVPAPFPALPNAAPIRETATPAAARAIESALTLDVNGVRVAIPAGVELTLEQDDAGALWYRAGGLRLGPVRFG